MNKIKSVCFNNFRVFKGKEPFNFMKEGRVADFICIYGQNGMGKSSFFDGVEWLFTGEIDRFKNDVKNGIENYEGRVLRNIYSKEDYAEVSVTLDNEESIKRKIKPRKNAKNDYKIGKLNDDKYKEIMSNKQILPHNKIDSFVYATKPRDKYKEWGEFWDLDGSQRKLFNLIYELNKQCEKKVETIKSKIESLNNELNDLSINNEIIECMNEKINQYNCTLPYKENTIELIRKTENKPTVIPKVEIISEQKLKLTSVKDKMVSILPKLEFLVDNNNYYNEFKQELLMIKRLKKRWQRIVALCEEKERYSIKKDLEFRHKEVVQREMENILKLYYAGKKWFEEYLQFQECIDKMKKVNNQIQLKKEQLIRENKNRENIEKLLQSVKQELFKIESNRDSLIGNSKKVLNLLQGKEEQNKRKFKLQENISRTAYSNKLIQTEIKQIIEAKFPDNGYNKSLINKLKIMIGSNENLINMRDKWMNEFEDIDNCIKKIEIDLNNQEKMYKEAQETFDNLEKILVEVKKHIETEKLSKCPVCNEEYHKTERLLARINRVSQQKNIDYLYRNYIDLKKQLNQWNKEKEKAIIKWNNECEDMIKKKLIEIEDNTENFNNMKKENYKINENILKIKEIINNITLWFKDLNYNNDINMENTQKWIAEICMKHEKKMINYNEKINNILKSEKYVNEEIIKLEKIFEESVKKYEEFIDNDNNKQLIDIFEKFNELKIWNDIVDKHNSLREKIININNIITVIDNNINKLSNIKIKKKEKYISKLSSLYLQEDKCEVIEKYENYCRQIFRSLEININTICKKQQKMLDVSNRVKIKIDILNYIASQVSITDYNDKYAKIIKNKKILEEQFKKYTYGRKKINTLFNGIKSEIGKNFEKVFSNKIMNAIYRKIEPHKTFQKLKYEVNFNDKDEPELYIKGTNLSHTQEVMPELFYSSAQLNTVALSSFLGGALSTIDSKIKTIFIDDPIGHFDDINALAFVDLLRSIISKGEWQIVMSTHDETLFSLLKNKISSDYYNSKFIEFLSVGTVQKNEILGK
ncbi:AAA family ATPase [Lutibacter sp. B2]|nr:AAA family ATPase [Lutibacter sp. B2]